MQIIQCPSCGGSNEIKNPGLTMTACRYCRSTLYWNDDAVVHAGEKAVLPERDSRLWLGATGHIFNKPFEVLGRLRLACSLGIWDEWFISYNDDFAWLGEVSHNLTLRRIIPDGESLMGRQRPLLGANLILAGNSLSIREADRAQCMTIEGELPFNVPPTESLNYFNATSADGQQNAQVSYNQAGKLRLTMGQTLRQEDLVLAGTESLISQYNNILDSKSLSCAHCGATMPSSPVAGMVTMTCAVCGALNDIGTGKESKLLGKRGPLEDSQALQYNIGTEFTVRDHPYQVCGRQILKNDSADKLCLYLLHAADKGYLYLFVNSADNTEMMLEELQEAPSGNAQQWIRLDKNDSLTLGNTGYRVTQHGHWTVTFVDGAFPWIATIGEDTDLLLAGDGHDRFFIMKKSQTKLQFFGHKNNIPKEAPKAAKEAMGTDNKQQRANSAKSSATGHKNSNNNNGKAKSTVGNKIAGGCGCGCLGFLLLGIIGILIDDTDEREEAMANAQATLVQTQSYADEYPSWQKELGYLQTTHFLDNQRENKYVTSLSMVKEQLDATTDAAKEIGIILHDNPDEWPKLAELDNSLRAANEQLKQEEVTLRELHDWSEQARKAKKWYQFFYEKSYKQIKPLTTRNPEEDWQQEVASAIGKWPTQESRLTILKNDRDEKKKNLLLLFNKIDNLGLTEETLKLPQAVEFINLMEQYYRGIDDYNDANRRLKSVLEVLEKGESKALPASDMKNDNTGNEKPGNKNKDIRSHFKSSKKK